MKRARDELGSFGVITVAAAAAIAVVVGGLFAVTHRIDTASKLREQTVAAHGLEAEIADLAHRVVPQANWDEAARNLALDFDPQWAAQNIGDYLGGSDGFNAALVINGADAPVYGWVNGQDRPAEAYSAVLAGAADVIRQVRAAEKARGSLARRQPTGGLIAPPIQANDVRRIGGESMIVTATLVQPDFQPELSRPRSAVIVTAKALDGAFLENFGRRFMLSDLRVAQDEPAAGLASAKLAAKSGETSAILVWTAQAPGAALARNVLPTILMLCAGLGAAILVLWRNARHAAKGLVASEARAKHMAAHDALTGLPNRMLFNERLGLALDRSRRTGAQVGVLVIDLDRFKEVNDTFGHGSGDELIREAARRLAGTVRAGETLARLGGDEFAIVQPEATAASAAALAERIRKVVTGPVEISAGRVYLACSSGVAVLQGKDVEPGEVLRQADLALYRAKERGKGGYAFFEPEMDAALRTRKALESDLREALEAEALVMNYQPQVNGKGKIVGLEALVRWTHPERGQVSPAYFVPIAEECGLIEQLGFYTLRHAFRDSRRWPHLKVAVNLSASQLRISDFVDRMKALVAEMKVDPANFELEITEGVLLGDDQTTHATLNALRDMGFGLALDDFGTGYSSLSYLRRFPVSKIKIDRSFITSLGIDKEAGAMVSAIVRLAKALGLSVIAEGVETDDQRQLLLAAGCTDIQGFLFGKPSAPEVIEDMLDAAKAAKAA